VNLIAVVKRVDFKNMLKGVFIGLSRPHFILPTINATKDCIAISTKNYGKLHHKNGPANAFRHAFWNYLIAKRCYNWQRNEKTVLAWAKKVTDWHEDSFPNKKLPREMDLHNNEVGRFIFAQNTEKSEQEVLELLKNMTLESIKIDENSTLSEHKDRMVHILEQ
jgi:phosphoserine aminotransferase